MRNWANNHLVSRRLHGYSLLHEPIEELASASGFAVVESEGELVEVVIQMFVTHRALMGAQQPALVGEDCDLTCVSEALGAVSGLLRVSGLF